MSVRPMRHWLAAAGWLVGGFAALAGSAWLGGRWPAAPDARDLALAGAGAVLIAAVIWLTRAVAVPARKGRGHRQAAVEAAAEGLAALPRSLVLQRQVTALTAAAALLGCAGAGVALLRPDITGWISGAALGAAGIAVGAIGWRTARAATSAGRVEAAALPRPDLGLPQAASGVMTVTIRYRPLPAMDRRTMERLIGNAIADAFADMEAGAQYGMSESTLYAATFRDGEPPKV
ncbi:MAG: hypothetical protein INF91_00755 [Alphaproteobacteria bacterium]|nr:hypothetical protein [Alphaproteobacteria bacterium]